jgi:hypothetical protein
MLIALTILFLTGGGSGFSFDNLKPYVKEYVSDGERVAGIETVIKRANDDLAAFFKRVNKEWSDTLIETNLNYASTREDFEKVFALVDAERSELQQRLIDHRFEVKDLTTREEWQWIHERIAVERARNQMRGG